MNKAIQIQNQEYGHLYSELLPLPPFINSEKIRNLLGWTPKIIQNWRKCAANNPYGTWTFEAGESWIDGIIRLFRTPGGMHHFNNTIHTNKRTENHGIFAKILVSCANKTRARIFFDIEDPVTLSRLIDLNEIEYAAYWAWLYLTMTAIDQDLAPVQIFYIEKYVNVHNDLKQALGEFWPAWRALRDIRMFAHGIDRHDARALDQSRGEALNFRITPSSRDENSAVSWDKHVVETIQRLQQSSEFDDLLPAALRTAAEKLEAAIAAEEVRQCRLIAERAEACANRLDVSLKSLETSSALDGSKCRWVREETRSIMTLHLDAVEQFAEGVADRVKLLENLDRALARGRDAAAADERAKIILKYRAEEHRRAIFEIESWVDTKTQLLKQGDLQGFGFIPNWRWLSWPSSAPNESTLAVTTDIDMSIPIIDSIEVHPHSALALNESVLFVQNIEAESQQAQELASAVFEPSFENGSNNESIDEKNQAEPVFMETLNKNFEEIPPDTRCAPAQAALWSALKAGRYGLALQVARAAEKLNLSWINDMPVAIFEALTIGAGLSTTRLILEEERLRRLEQTLLSHLEHKPSRSLRILAFAAAIRPALFTLDSSTYQILRCAHIEEFSPELHALNSFLAKQLPGHRLHLTPEDLVLDDEASNGEEHVKAAKAALLALADESKPSNRKNMAFTKLFGSEIVLNAVAAVRDGKADAPDAVAEAIGWLEGEGSDKGLETVDQNTQRKERGLRREALDVLKRWIAANRANVRKHASSYQSKIVYELIKCLKGAIKAFDIEEASDPGLAEVVATAKNVLLGIFTPDRAHDLSVEMLLQNDILVLNPPPSTLNYNDWVEADAERIIEQARSHAAQHPDFDVITRRLAKQGRFPYAQSAMERLKAEGQLTSDLDTTVRVEYTICLQDSLKRARDLRRRIDDLLSADRTQTLNANLSLQLDLQDRLLQGSNAHNRRVDLHGVMHQLDLIEVELDRGFADLMKPLREDIDRLPESFDKTELEAMAAHHDVAALVEHLEAAKAGVAWDSRGAAAGLDRFAQAFLTSNSIKAWRPTKDVPDEMIELRDAWRELAEQKSFHPKNIVCLMSALGFVNVRCELYQESNNAGFKAIGQYHMECEWVKRRDDCVVPAFGSEAKGTYNILIIDIKNNAKFNNVFSFLEGRSNKPTFVIATGFIDFQMRKKFMIDVRKIGNLLCGLIDEAVIAQLMSQTARNLAAMFELSLPMGRVQPYADTAAYTSLEMFYGRRQELERLWDPNGSCLVYGGRQLGKSALLKQVQLRYHRPPQSVVVYGDIPGEHFDIQGKDAFWAWLSEKLTNVIGANPKGSPSESVIGGIKNWLNQHKERRVLILVDEADTFLRSETQNQYKTLRKIRRLMEETERRCKFVFAGLHDVQRMTRDSNSPLLHFGMSISVGPLMGQEIPEARAMLQQPLAAAGFMFKNPYLLGSILSRLGYYPSLVQTFGKSLIERLNNSYAVLAEDPLLPIIIGEKEVDAIFDNNEFRDNLRSKFEATLNLDKRYCLIAYIILLEGFKAYEHGNNFEGMKDVEIYKDALEWWKAGFPEDSSFQGFQGLLREMVGLGVLVQKEDNRYVIRSARIGDMLGGKEQVDIKLLELSETNGPHDVDTGVLRRIVGRRPSPFTKRQESMLIEPANPGVGLFIVLGLPDLGTDHIPVALKDLASDQLSVIHYQYATTRQIKEIIDQNTRRWTHMHTIVVLRGPWIDQKRSEDIFDYIKMNCHGIKHKLIIMLVPEIIDLSVFDSTRLWGAEVINLVPLGIDAIRQFLKDAFNQQVDPAIAAQVQDLTDGSPRLLEFRHNEALDAYIGRLKQ